MNMIVNGFIGAPMAEGKDALERAFAAFSGEAKATAEKVAGLGDKLSVVEAAIDEINRSIAAGKVGGSGNDARSVRAAIEAFGSFAKTGKPDAMRKINAAMSVDSDPNGGYTVPEEIGSTIISTQRDMSTMRQIAQVRSTRSDVYEQLVSVHGGTATWVGEREARPETDHATLKALQYPSAEIYANVAVTQKLLDDSSFDIGMFVQNEIAEAFTDAEGDAFVNGNGVNKPRGLLAYTNVSTGDATREFGQIQYVPSGVSNALNDATHNGADVLIDTVYALKAGYRRGARWLMNSTTAGVVRKLKSLGDTENYLWRDSMAEGEPPTLLGYPVSFDENMPSIGADQYPIAFGDFQRGYLITDRIGIRVLRDPYTNKPYVMFYVTKRVGGGLLDSNAIKLVKCATS